MQKIKNDYKRNYNSCFQFIIELSFDDQIINCRFRLFDKHKYSIYLVTSFHEIEQ